ncbi:MAG: LysM peptidoglycan-binding domain-containing protein [bacterium]|nr:LysM peptidoglycan-binding domain-containing protein [bacterium]
MRLLRTMIVLLVVLVGIGTQSVFAVDLVNCERDHIVRKLGMAQPSVDAKFKQMDEAFTKCLAPKEHNTTIDKFRKAQNFVDRKRFEDAEVALHAFFNSADHTLDIANQNLRVLAIDLLKKEGYQGEKPKIVNLNSEGGAHSENGSELEIGAVPVPAPVLSVNSPGLAVSTSKKSDVARVYIAHKVAAGDSLWNLSKKHYGYGEYWYELFLENEGKIENPRVIYIGQELRIPKPRRTPSN